MKITVVGTGYVGLVSGVCMSEIGHNVTCLDVNKKIIEKLKRGKVPYYEPGLDEMIKMNLKKSNLKFSSSYKQAVKNVDTFFICVGTPENKDGSSNLKYIYEVAKSLAVHISQDSILYTKSTVPIGTNSEIQDIVNKYKRDEVTIDVASNPEFLKEGDAVNDFMNPDRIIVGTSNDHVINHTKKIYQYFIKLGKEIIFMQTKAAELTKYAANSFLATKISFMNELSLLSETMGIDIDDVKKGIGSDPRIGDKFLNAGLGFGGSCFPKDLSSLISVYKTQDLESNILKSVVSVNTNQRKNFYKKIKEYFKRSKIKEKSLLIWGLSFKPNTDDIRESVAIKLIKDLSNDVKKIYVFDPIAMENSKKELKLLNNVEFLKSQYSKIDQCNGLIICTDWDEFKMPNINKLDKLKDRIIFDGRNCLNKEILFKNNIKYKGIGI